MAHEVLGLCLLAVFFLLLRYINRTDVPKIKGLPEIPGALPVFGNLLQLGNLHCKVAGEWAKKYGWPVYQTRLGNRVRPTTTWRRSSKVEG